MNPRRHLALLRAASWLAPAAGRAEWIAEWRAELWYVGLRRRTAFCMGAFRDAFWLRRHAPPAVRLQSPWQCLAVLALLAALSVFFAAKLPLPREMFFSRPLPPGLVTVSGITLSDYRLFPAEQSQAAFYGREALAERGLTVALASRNLFSLLRVPLSTSPDAGAVPLVITRSAWRRNFAGDPHIVGRRLIIKGRPAQVAAVISDRVWRLPGYAQAWLLVDDANLPGATSGYVIAHLSAPASHVSIHRTDGGVDGFRCSPLDEPAPLLVFLLLIALSAPILPAVTDLSLRRYQPDAHAFSHAAAARRWLFLAAKIALVMPIVLFGSADLFSLIAVNLQAHSVVVGTVVGLRWILIDQGRRCPVCLRLLTNPTPIGEPSRTLLEWYGTELICTRGHGLLHVPEIRSSYSESRWLYLDSSWSGLFRPQSAGR